MLPIISAVASLAGTWLEGKQAKAKLKQTLEVAKVQAQVKRVEQDGNWDEKAVASMDSSWKDEAWTNHERWISFFKHGSRLYKIRNLGKYCCKLWLKIYSKD